MRNKDWSEEIPLGALVSKKPTYNAGEYFNFFKEDSADGMKYYFFDGRKIS